MNVQEPAENVDAFIDLAFPGRHHRDILKQIAKIHTTLKRDAFNILNLHLRRFLENEEAFAAAPDFTNQTLYAKAYRLASVMLFHDVPRGELMHDIANKADDPWVEDLRDTFATFQNCRRGPQRQALYVIPEMNTSLLGIMSVRFANQAMSIDLQDAYITDGSYRSSALIFLCATRFYNRRFGRHYIVLTMSSDEGGDTGANPSFT
ncbi:hypothetical protein BJV82DRAFT_578182 [Fennellomyces sp. T-0311]|nr:hypothetical protein BJV82DRAFT_578182 [Fennellomyces sp. T-0311]